ncbi:gas vesicle protein GvpO [Alkalicoccus daliensis]|uniref:Gas vesicle synthesis protein GvpO n=1 Tax=Alkalicoccus daliensis TaxID=745820 RepID=A0A1H0DU74_9BACI|nr:gas vesicle protein GvpO [Alkalicoccus daliensis]SDN73596.1 Gas vesicle synthesis protein GvpO [Alkalicoccus daliensis]
MKTEELMNTVRDYFEEHLSPVHRFTSIVKKENEWELGVEVIEEKEYMKRYGRDQLIGSYSVHVDEDGDVTSFERIALRQRTSTDFQQEAEV